MTSRTEFLLALVAIALAGCGGGEDVDVPGMAEPATAGLAEGACITAINARVPADRATVLRSELSGSGSPVMLRSRDGTNWRCIATENGIVEELTIV